MHGLLKISVASRLLKMLVITRMSAGISATIIIAMLCIPNWKTTSILTVSENISPRNTAANLLTVISSITIQIQICLKFYIRTSL